VSEAVGRGVVSIEADTEGLGKDIESKVGRESGTITKAFGGIGRAAGAALKAAAVAATGGVIAAIGFGKQAVSAASDLSESTSKVNVVFGDQAAAVVDWSKKSAKAMGQSQQQALEAAGTYGNLFQSFGLGQKQATDMSTSLVGLATDLASFNNTSVADALAALQSGVSGETEPLKRFGVAIDDVRLHQEAMKLGLIKTVKDALTPAAKAQASYSLIMQDTTLAQGDFARTSDGLANSQRIMAAEFENAKASIGQALLPAMTAVVTFISEKAIPWFQKLAQRWLPVLQRAFATVADWVAEHWPQIREILVGVLSAIGDAAKGLARWFVDHLLPVFISVAQWVGAHWPQIREVIATVLEAVGAAVMYVVTQVIPALASGLQATVGWLIDHKEVLIGVAAGIGAALVALFIAWAAGAASAAAATLAAAAPFIAIGAAIAALVAGVIYAYTHWEWFRTVVDAVGTFLKDTLWPILQSVFGWLRDNVPGIIQWVIDKAQALWDKTEGLRAFLADAFRLGVEVAATAFQGLVDAGQWVWDKIDYLWTKSEGFRAFLADAFTLGVGIAKAAFEAFRDIGQEVIDKVKLVWGWTEAFRAFLADAFSLGVGVAKAAFGFMRDVIGEVITQVQLVWGWTEGLRGFLSDAFSAGVGVAKAALDGVVSTLEAIIRTAETAWNWLNKINPFSGGDVVQGDWIGGPVFKPPPPGNARGSMFWRGGPTKIGENNKFEIATVADIPTGARIYPNWQSEQIMRQLGRAAPASDGPLIGEVHIHEQVDAQAVFSMANLYLRSAAA